MAKQLNVSLGFTADTSQAKAQLQELQMALTKLTQTSASKTSGLGLTKEINDAINAASELQVKLQQSINSTGSLDLGKFNQSLQQSGKKLSDYANQLKALGPEGQAAFSKLARSISLAEVPLKKSNKLLSEFATTMKNTVRWQLSSSMLHGFIGSIQSAYRYSQDLNESLNNIRIVTGASVDEMDKFAEKANKAARALSATTTEYTDAALIFYQQGLNDDQVEERTNATIKMAHAAGESAEEVSSYMTAIWNNFDDGTKSLEYYGDVMTKLGAATAASSAEIAEGLEKFASIGETVGLSYEYATSAIATIVDKTRQSADTVGTAFKTIFSRLQGLQLGETLEDGTDLNKYSSALMSVGISIKDANGELKDMDTILDEMGAKWKTLHRDEQMALAQTVAGVRQYTQLMSLMNNYDDFKVNVDLAENSEGTLSEQADIYAESWEAARDRVTAAAEAIYEELLEDDVFITLLNGFANLIDGIDLFIDSIGGLKGVLPLLSTVLLKTFGKDLADSINRSFYNIKLGSEIGREEIRQLRQEAIDAQREMLDDGSVSGSAKIDVFDLQAQTQQKLLDKTLELQGANKELTAEERQQAQALLDISAALGDQYIKTTENLEAQKMIEESLIRQAGTIINRANNSQKEGDGNTKYNDFQGQIKQVSNLQKSYQAGVVIVNKYKKAVSEALSKPKGSDAQKKVLDQLKESFLGLASNAEMTGDVISGEILEAIKKLSVTDIDKLEADFNNLGDVINNTGDDAYDLFETIRQNAQSSGANMAVLNPILNQIQASFNQTGALTSEQIQLFANLGIQVNAAGEVIDGFKGKVATIGDAVSSGAQAASSLAMALNQASTFGEKLFDKDATAMEKFTSGIMLAVTTIQTFNAIRTAQQTITEAIIALKQKENAATLGAIIAEKARTLATNAANTARSLAMVLTGKMTVAEWLQTAAVEANTAAWYSNPILAVIAVALMAVVAVIGAVSSAMEANSEKIAENAEKSREQAAASKEVFDANQDMINSYEQALQAYEKDESAKDDLISISQDLCEQLDIEGAALLRAKGDYDALTEAIYKNQKAKIDTALEDNQRAQNDTSSEFVDNMRTDTGRFSGDSYIADIGTMWQSINDESIVSDAISNLGDEVSHIAWDGTIQVKTGQSTQELRQAYEEVLAVVEEVEAIAGDDTELLNNSENYQAMLDWLDKSKDSYEALIALENEEAELRTAQIVNDAVANGQSISTLEEYEALRSQVVADLQSEVGLTEEQANSIADTYLKQSAAVSELAESYSVLQDASKVSGIVKDDLKAWYSNLDEDEQKLFATLNFDSAQSTADLDAQLEVLQARADRTSIKTKLDVVEGAKDSLKKDMSADDYAAYQTESGIDWGNAEEGIMEYSDFLAMSYESQVSYLEGLSAKYTSELNDATATAIATNQERINELDGLILDANAKVSEFESSFDMSGISLDLDGNGTMATTVEQVTNEILKLNNLDVDSQEYKDLLEKLKNSGIDEATIQSYLDAHNAATAYRQEVEYLGEEIDDLTEQGQIDTIINVKTNLEGAETLGDLKAKWHAALAEAGDAGLDFTLYSEALLGLAENYDNCTTEIDEYKEALNRAGEADAQYRAAVERGDENVTQYKEALDEANESLKEHVAQLEAAVMIGEASDKYGLDAKDVETQAKMLKKLHPELNLTEEAAANLAIANQRMNKGVQKLHDNWKDWSKVLKKTDKSTGDYAEVLNDANEALADLVGVTDAAAIPLDFLDSSTESGAKHLEWMEQAANGDVEAINKLGAAMAQCTVEAMEFDATMAQSAMNAGLIDQAFDLTAFENYKSEVLEGITALQTQLENGTIAAGQNITSLMDGTGESWVNSLNAMAMATGMGVEQMNSLLNQLGVQAKVDVVEVPQTMKVPTYTEYVEATDPISYQVGTDPEGNPIMGSASGTRRFTVPGPSVEVEGIAQVAQISTEEGNVGAPQITYTGTSGGGLGGGISPSSTSGSGSGGGDGSKPKKAEKKKKTDVVERYKKIEDKLDDVRDAQDKASKSADRLYGADRLKQMQKINQTLAKEVELLQEKKKEAEAYLKVDQQELNNLAKQNGLSFIFDEKGNISNYEEQFTKLWTELDTAINRANADGDATEEEQEKIDKIQERIDTIKEALEQYEETRELIEDIELELQDKIYEIQDNNFEQLNYKFEIKMEISDNSLKWIDYQLEKIEDDFYRAAEAVALFFNTLNQDGTKYGQTLEQVKITTQQFAEAEKMYNTFDKDGNRLISQANYIEAMNQTRDSYYDQLTALQEIDDAMMNYYSDTLDKASEELAKYTDQMDHLSGVLEYYNSLMTLMGKEKDYEKMGIILDGQLKVAEDKLAVSEATYQMSAAEVKKYEDDIASGLYGSMSDVEKELFDKEYQAALQKANEAEEEFLSSAEATIEAWKAKMQNELDGFGRDLEKALTGGTSFDWLITTMERMNSLHEEYLTTTNKIYETNKLMNQAQKEIDKSSNSIAKRKLKDFIEQTKSLQNQTALSKFELDIQQAKYDLLLAEIALEEAQNAKSQVRLQRDSEGNFGYIYTADSSAIDDAQQKLQDAQNNLYNISLDGANKYAEQEVQIRQEMYDTLRELETQYQEGSFASLEEYETARDEAMSYYYDKLEQASNLYNVAISADASAAAEHILGQEYLVAEASFGTFGDIARNWQSRLITMKSNTETWKTGVADYVDEVISKFGAWETFCVNMSERTSLTDLANQVGDITGKSEELRKKITDPTNGVIKALSDEFAAVQKVTGEYGKQREKVQGLITDIENYIKALDNKQKAEVGDLDKDEKEENKEEKQETSSNTSNKNTTQEVGELAATAKELVGKVHRGEIGNSKDGWILSAKAVGYSEDAIVLALKAFNDSKPGAGYDYYYNEALKILDSYDTGGYTGNWDGSYGKLAMVHKKELILKEGDTANFLASMEVLERILSIIDLQSANAQYVGAINSPALKFTGQDTLEQNVHIEASFPNATDRNEIEEAFKDIVNLASQYANRK